MKTLKFPKKNAIDHMIFGVFQAEALQYARFQRAILFNRKFLLLEGFPIK